MEKVVESDSRREFMQSISKTMKPHYNFFTKAVEFVIDSFKVIIFFRLRFIIPSELLDPVFIPDFALCLLDPVWEALL